MPLRHRSTDSRLQASRQDDNYIYLYFYALRLLSKLGANTLWLVAVVRVSRTGGRWVPRARRPRSSPHSLADTLSVRVHIAQ